MSISPYVRQLRAHVGSMRLLLPSVSVHLFDAEGRLLLVRQREGELWSTPGGLVEPDERPADAAAREVWEETGLRIRPERLLGVYGGPECVVRYANGDEVQYVITAMGGRIVGGAPRPDRDETMDVRYWSEAEAAALPLAPWLRALLPMVYAGVDGIGGGGTGGDGIGAADSEVRESRVYTFARYAAAFIIALYGFAKLNGAQFTILDSELDKPLRDVSGFWLTWYYFGYSAVYGGFLALAQIVGALLLTLPRTALLGAAVLSGMMVNVVLIDLCYGVDLGGLGAALVVSGLLAVILSHHGDVLRRTFWTSPRVAPRAASGRVARRALGVAGRVLLFAVPAAFTYWVANVNNRLPTPIDGAWYPVGETGATLTRAPTAIYFERNRAMMAVIRYPDGWATHHFEVDTVRHAVRIWEHWLTKGPGVFAGAYVLAGDRLALRGEWAGVGPVQIELRRRGRE